jgi:hypothetical protein
MVKGPATTSVRKPTTGLTSSGIDKPSKIGSAEKVFTQKVFKQKVLKLFQQFAKTEAGRVAIFSMSGSCATQLLYQAAVAVGPGQSQMVFENCSSLITLFGLLKASRCANNYVRWGVQHVLDLKSALKSALNKPAPREKSADAPAPGKGQDPETNLKELKDLARASLPPAKKATSNVPVGPACFQPLEFLNQPLEFDFALLGHSQGQEQIISPSFLKVKIVCCPQYGVSNAEELKQHFDRAMDILPAKIATDVVPILDRKHVLVYLGLKEDSADANQKFAEKLVKQWQHAPVVVNH